jgi:hypothetical protein
MKVSKKNFLRRALLVAVLAGGIMSIQSFYNQVQAGRNLGQFVQVFGGKTSAVGEACVASWRDYCVVGDSKIY